MAKCNKLTPLPFKGLKSFTPLNCAVRYSACYDTPTLAPYSFSRSVVVICAGTVWKERMKPWRRNSVAKLKLRYVTSEIRRHTLALQQRTHTPLLLMSYNCRRIWGHCRIEEFTRIVFGTATTYHWHSVIRSI